jgi:hypothetical protein
MQHNKTPHRKSEKKPFMPTKRKDETKFDSENDEAEINPEKLDREETDFDRAGFDQSKGHEPYDFKKSDDPGYKPRTKAVDINKFGKDLH